MKALLAELGFQGDSATVTWIVSHPEMELMVAADGFDKVIGFVALSHRPNLRHGGRIATIDELVVGKAWRRKGVGRELLKRALERAKVLGVKRLEVQSLEANGEEGAPFLKACGMAEAGLHVFKL
ncbi:MAG: GNAT family N-acetyltransferase [Archangiaceae bacterium]|nr:GNAT family N-acetyltransferase [Archangiaceae bacterium]